MKEPGLNWKLPAPLQTSNSFEKRLLEYDVPPEEILSKDKKSLIIDNYVRWRITDPLLFLQTVAAVPTAKTRLDDIVYSELRQELGTHDMVEIITENRELIMEKVTVASNEETSKYGIEVIDVRIRRVDLPQENESSIYARMEAERKRQANKFRSEEKRKKLEQRLIVIKRLYLQMLTKHHRKFEVKERQRLWIFTHRLFQKTLSFMSLLGLGETFEKVIDDKTTLVLPGDSKLFKELVQ